MGRESSTEENEALGRALDLYVAKGDAQQIEPLLAYLETYPDSTWKPSLLLNIGSVFQRAGFPNRAISGWRQAWNGAKDTLDPNGVGGWSAANLALLLAKSGRVNDLQALLDETRNHVVRDRAATFLAEARIQLDLMKTNANGMFRCGPTALGSMAMAMGKGDRVQGKLDSLEVGTVGTSLDQIETWAKEMGVELMGISRSPGADFPVPAILHWKIGHFGTVVQKEGDRYLVRNYLGEPERWVSRNSLEEETGPLGLVPAGIALGDGLKAARSEDLARVMGTGPTSGQDSKNPCKGPTTDQCSLGMPVYSLLPAQTSVQIEDTPLWYTPPFGPPVRFHLTYNNTDVQQPQYFSFWNFGAKWTSDWMSYIIDDPANPGHNVSLYQRGGGIASYSGYNAATGAFSPQYYHQDILIRTSQTSYERRLPDGSKEEFTVSNGGVGPRYIFMSKVFDTAGNGLTLNYDSNMRLISVIDAMGQVTTLGYTGTNPLLVTTVQDPFGRLVKISYDASTDDASSASYSTATFLGSITDMGGLTSYFKYSTSNPNGLPPIITNQIISTPIIKSVNTASASRLIDLKNTKYIQADDGGVSESPSPPPLPPNLFPFITSMSTPYGTTRFIGTGAGMDAAVQVTDPLGQREKIEYHNFTGGMPLSETIAPPNFTNSILYYRNAFYWDKRAMAQAPGDWTAATIYHFNHSANNIGTTSPTIESIKKPLENRIWYSYPGQGATYFEGSNNLPAVVARVLNDGTVQETQTQYNPVGHPTQITDPFGRITNYTYSADGVDLLQVANTTGGSTAVLATYQYNSQHRPLTITDASGQVTRMTYNASGQVLTITDPKKETTTFTYNPTQGGYLVQIDGPLPGSTTKITYDPVGRVSTVTDPEGRTVGMQYDNLDRTTAINFPDGTNEYRLYTNLDLTGVIDRKGQITGMIYNPLRQLTQILDAQGRLTQLNWCNCGSLEQLIDPMGQITNWWRDLQGRVIGKSLADQTQASYSYDLAGRMVQRIDAKGQVTQYQYTVDDKLAQVSYPQAQNPTPTVTYSYDPKFPRLATMTDGIGTTSYSYYPFMPYASLGVGRLASVNGPFPNSEIDYSYDELGRVISRGISGANENRSFDSLGRTTVVSNPLGTFQYGYVGGTNRLSAINLPNGQTTNFAYFDGSNDFRLRSITNQRNDQSVISAFSYTYDANGLIATWSRQADASLPTVYTFQLDAANQLLGAVLRDSGGNLLHQYAYGYDLAGNRVGEQIDNQLTSSGYNNVNQLINQATSQLSVHAEAPQAAKSKAKGVAATSKAKVTSPPSKPSATPGSANP